MELWWVTFVHLDKIRTPLLLDLLKQGKQIERSPSEQLCNKCGSCSSYTTWPPQRMNRHCWEIPLSQEKEEPGSSGLLFAGCWGFQPCAHGSATLQGNPWQDVPVPCLWRCPWNKGWVPGVWRRSLAGSSGCWLLLKKSLLWKHWIISLRH